MPLLEKDVPGLVLAEGPVLLLKMRLQLRLQRGSVQQLHDQVNVGAVLQQVEYLDDVGVVEVCQQLVLVDEALDVVFF